MSEESGNDNRKYGSIACEHLEAAIENSAFQPAFQIIDVRGAGEYSEGHIPGAKLLSITDPGFIDNIEELDPDLSYYVYCRSGVRSQKACALMAKAGFEKVYNLEDGLLEWTGPLEK